MITINLPYCVDLSPEFNKLAKEHWSIWLDSGYSQNNSQRYDMISCWPYQTITANLYSTSITKRKYDKNFNLSNSKSEQYNNTEHNPFNLVKNILDKLTLNNKHLSRHDNNIPFWHGAMGYFGYDLNQLLHDKLILQDSSDIPIMAVGIYPWALISDHSLKKTYIVYDSDYLNTDQISYLKTVFINISIQTRSDSHQLTDISKNFKFTADIDYQTYAQNFLKIKQHIADGDCYQINYSVKFTSSNSQDIPAWQTYQYLRNINPNPFSCYFNISEDLTIMSFSPERFLKTERIDNQQLQVTTQPIKGTRKKYADDNLNQQAMADLISNPKDRAENVMIVDLMRNDLNKYCLAGSVVAKEICKLNTYATVHHLVSTITGQLKTNISSIDLFKGCFPGGSITGAPKVRSMQIIQELENKNNLIHRYVYCGTIGYINLDGHMDTNIAIRTLVQDKSNYHYWAGGGIVADSDCNNEYNEVLSKIIKTALVSAESN